MIGVEIASERLRNRIVQQAFKEGLLLLGCGFRSIRIAPPLIISKDEAEHGLFILERIVKSS